MKKEISLQPLLDYYDWPHPVDWSSVFQRRAPLEVEIGFGMGEFLVRCATESPEKNFVGIEQHWERIHKTMKRIHFVRSRESCQPDNIRLLKIDARVALDRLFAERSVDCLYCLFPCPWPKKGHVKHRLFSRDFLRMVNSRLTKGGRVHIVTDFYPYAEWIAGQSPRTGFDLKENTVAPRYATKFEKKWQREGQERFFEIILNKKKHIRASLPEDIVLKTYKIDGFAPERFLFSDQTGAVTVIFKEMIFDEKQQKALVYVIVAEQHLTQHLRISIFKKSSGWCVRCAEGQKFFPSPGIAKAIDLVARAAQTTTQT